MSINIPLPGCSVRSAVRGLVLELPYLRPKTDTSFDLLDASLQFWGKPAKDPSADGTWAEPEAAGATSNGNSVQTGIRLWSTVVHLPSTANSGLCLELSSGSSVHGRMYTDKSRAFSSGEKSARGTLAKDQTGR